MSAVPTDRARLASVHAFFREHNEDPRVYAQGFFEYHLRHGLTPEQIFRIACGPLYGVPQQKQKES